MSFTSMHNDYLDPDRYAPGEDYGYDAIKAALQARDSGRWGWARIDCCWTGKDGDLDTYGQQGVELVSVDEEFAYFTAHAGLTVPGTDVSLNVRSDLSEAQYDRKLEQYLEVAQAAVWGFGASGYWDGDSWCLSTAEQGKAPVILTEDGEIDVEATADAIVHAAEEALAQWDRECEYLDHIIGRAAGWRDSLGRRRRALK